MTGMRRCCSKSLISLSNGETNNDLKTAPLILVDLANVLAFYSSRLIPFCLRPSKVG